MKIVLGDFNAEVGRQDIFKLIIGNESLHEVSNNNGGQSSKFCDFKKSNCQEHNFPILRYSYTHTFSDGVAHNQIDHVLIDKRRNSNTHILDV
jgi:endonuclease/exonuclease/phosphatase family metal-dependent hydrolase